jgi:hypothetical protein
MSDLLVSFRRPKFMRKKQALLRTLHTGWKPRPEVGMRA